MNTMAMVALLLMMSEPQSHCPMHAKHTAAAAAADGSHKHGKEVDRRHDTFGMSHASTRHNFRLFRDGGAIELRANDAADAKTVGVIREHLQAIAAEFTKGEFSTPAFVHGKTPHGVDDMKRLGAAIAYRYETLPEGGRIRLTGKDPGAVAAIHSFMKFQVIEHRTGDRGEVEEEPAQSR